VAFLLVDPRSAFLAVETRTGDLVEPLGQGCELVEGFLNRDNLLGGCQGIAFRA
jgi:hypothetical protein